MIPKGNSPRTWRSDPSFVSLLNEFMRLSQAVPSLETDLREWMLDKMHDHWTSTRKAAESKLPDTVGASPSNGPAAPMSLKDDPLLTTAEVADMCGVSSKTIENWRSKGTGPKVRKLGHTVRYRKSDVLLFIDNREI